ncbi:MAG: hypothetical protein ACLS4Z_08300 [Christensenellaceae bacterium]
MFGGMYKKILDRMPAGVFVFDDKLRVRFTNEAFRRSFSDKAKQRGKLKETLGCGESAEECGQGASCAYCAFRNVMLAAVKDGKEKADTVSTSVRHADRTDKITVRIRILPADESGKLFLGLTDGTYQTEIAREMLSAQRMQQRLLPAGKRTGDSLKNVYSRPMAICPTFRADGRPVCPCRRREG